MNLKIKSGGKESRVYFTLNMRLKRLTIALKIITGIAILESIFLTSSGGHICTPERGIIYHTFTPNQ